MKIRTIFLAASLMFLMSCGNTEKEKPASETTQENVTPADSSASGDDAQVVYQCPMKCEGDKTYSGPGACPVCGMDLEKI